MLTIAGVGPGNPKYLTWEVRQAIEKSKYTLAFGRVAKSLKSINKNIIEVKTVKEVLDYLDKSQDILLLASGDPNFFGIVDFIQNKGVAIKDVLAGLSSFQYFMAKLKKPWQEARFLSLHGREDDLYKIKEYPLSIILTDKNHNPAYISRKLKGMNIKGRMYIGFNLSYEDEIILTKEIGEKIEDISSLAVVVIENEMA